jgi:hypothetical protein
MSPAEQSVGMRPYWLADFLGNYSVWCWRAHQVPDPAPNNERQGNDDVVTAG